MNLVKKLQYKYLQSSYRPRKNKVLSKDSFGIIDEMEKYLDKSVSKIIGTSKEKES